MYVVVDSSGLKVYGGGEWKVRQHGAGKRRTWRKIHLAVDEKTGEIVAEVLTKNDADDAGEVPGLLTQARSEGIKVDRFAGDGAYDKRKCYDYLIEREIIPVIPPRRDAQYWHDENGDIPEDHPRNKALIEIDQGGENASRAKWKINAKYHRRSLSENAFFRWKTIFGAALKNRKFEHQQTEAAVKASVLNVLIQVAKPVSVKAA